jgi:hypothetical protein
MQEALQKNGRFGNIFMFLWFKIKCPYLLNGDCAGVADTVYLFPDPVPAFAIE